MLLSELVNTPDGGLTAAYAGFLSISLYALTFLIRKWIYKSKEKTHKENEKLKLELTYKLAEDVELIKSELKTNGGSSIKDVVNKIDEKLDKTSDEVGALHRKVENIIAQERGRTEFALNLSHVAQFLANQKGEITYANDAMADLFGLGKSHLLRNKWMVAVDDQHIREEIVRRYSFAAERKILFVMTDIPIRNQNTETQHFVKLSIEPVTDANDNFMWNLGKIIEITKK